MFPAPRELNRFLYIYEVSLVVAGANPFPAPLEVDRFLYNEFHFQAMETLLFPAPLEVDRFLYFMSIDKISMERMFPAPREVDRFLYTSIKSVDGENGRRVSVPSRGR